MVLYKYLNPSRVDVLQERIIRFSQLAELNDPHEGAPEVTGAFANDLVNSKVMPLLMGTPFEDWLAQYFAESFNKLLPLDRGAVDRETFVSQSMESVRPHMPELQAEWI